jgi:hypothetical protein
MQHRLFSAAGLILLPTSALNARDLPPAGMTPTSIRMLTIAQMTAAVQLIAALGGGGGKSPLSTPSRITLRIHKSSNALPPVHRQACRGKVGTATVITPGMGKPSMIALIRLAAGLQACVVSYMNCPARKTFWRRR